MIVNFEKLSLKGTRKVIDSDGKKHQVTRNFSQTLNPYNRDKDGGIKSRDQILKEIHEEWNAWHALSNEELWKKEKYRFQTWEENNKEARNG